MLKLFLRKILIKILQPLGFYLTYYSSAVKIKSSLSKESIAVKEFELKRVFDTIGVANNHKFYNSLLREFTSNWQLKINKASFIGFGAGASSLSTFRKVQISERILHEKIYFTTHKDLKRILWFYKNCSHIVNNAGIALPNVYKVYSGEVITAFYTEFVALKKLNLMSKEKSLVQFSTKLYKLSLTNKFELLLKEISEDVKDFQSHFEYKKNRPKAKKILKEHHINIEFFEAKVNQSRYVLTHGDIQDTNAFENDVLIDWDSVGVYPIGLDAAFLLFYLIMKDEKESTDIFVWLESNYKSEIEEKDWKSFKLNVLFFLFVFIQLRLKESKYNNLNKALIKLLLKNVK